LTYVNGELEGPTKAWWPNGNLEYEGQYAAGVPVGQWTYYYESGNKEKDGTYADGFECGAWVFYYDNPTACTDQACQVERQGSLEAGYECGPWQYFWENGNTQAEGSYFGVSGDGNAQRCGQWTEYDQGGQVSGSPSYDPCPSGVPMCGSC